MATVTVSRTADRLIAVKQVKPGRVGDIEREAATLKRLDHPGVVRFVNVVETRDGGRALHTEFVNSDTWATRPLIDPADRAEGVAALAGVVADLHDLGIAHCRIDPSHVLYGEDDRPVLCGLRLAAETTPENRRDDLVALADLCCDPALERGQLTGKLSALADAARAGRLSPRELSRRLDLLLDRRSSPAEVTQAADGGSRGRGTRSKPRSLLVVAALVSASAVVLAAGIWSRSGQTTSSPATITDTAGPPTTETSAPVPAGTATTAEVADNTTAEVADNTTADAADNTTAATTEAADSTTADAADNTTAATTEAADSTTADAADSATAEVADSATAESPTRSPAPMIPLGSDRVSLNELVAHERGELLEHGGSLYRVGSPGDFVETGDWDCDGQPSPAIVRPSTGHVVLFDAWPGPGQSISMPVRWEVDTPTGVETVAHGDCDLLRVYTPAGSKLFDPMENQ